jgi:hypothetical protein
VPAVVVASQAFLITIALSIDASPARRLIASAAAFVTLLGAAHLFWKQMFGFALYEAVIKSERRTLELLVDRDSPLVNASRLEERFHREWLERDAGGNLVVGSDGHALPRRTIRWRATRIWLGIVALLALLDIALGVWAVYDWFDFNWFDSDPGGHRGRFRYDDD